MMQAQFKVRCPFQINDRVVLVNNQTAVITDILTIHSLKTGNTEFQYELDNSGRYVKFAAE